MYTHVHVYIFCPEDQVTGCPQGEPGAAEVYSETESTAAQLWGCQWTAVQHHQWAGPGHDHTPPQRQPREEQGVSLKFRE